MHGSPSESDSTLIIHLSAVYRTIELADGWNGKVISTQRWFSTSPISACLALHPTLTPDFRRHLRWRDGRARCLRLPDLPPRPPHVQPTAKRRGHHRRRRRQGGQKVRSQRCLSVLVGSAPLVQGGSFTYRMIHMLSFLCNGLSMDAFHDPHRQMFSL